MSNKKTENRKQRKLATLKKKHGEMYEAEWREAWDRYVDAKKRAQEVTRKKIAKWEEEQARVLSTMPRGQKEKEGWRRLKRNLGRADSHQVVKLKAGGRETTDEKEITDITKEFWRQIIWKEEDNEGLENHVIHSETKSMERIEIDRQDIDLALKAIKEGKAGGTDGIVGELIKHGGGKLSQGLASLFQEILEIGDVPQDWRKSRVTLIHKGGGKPREEIGSYRPIAVVNVLAKVFGWVLNNKVMKWVEEQRILGEEQSGFRPGRGGLENALVLKELIERSRRTGSELYLTFIDLEKAYDTVNRRKLFRLLAHIGIEDRVVQVIRKMYEDNEVNFTLGDISTGWMGNNVGVRQGCVMSPTLFNLYIEELLVRIRKSERGVRVGDSRLGGLAYADDIVLVAERKEDMEELLRIAQEYGREWDIRYSERKCKVIEYNSAGGSQWVLGNSILEVVDKYTYLGLEINKEGVGGERQRKINEGKARRMTGMIINGGNRSINKYEIGRSLWKGMAVPYCLYGSEITYYREGDLTKLEKSQNIIGRWSLGVPNSTAVEAIRGEMGWSTFRERVVKGKLNLLKKIEGLSEDRWVKKVLSAEGNSSWKKEMQRWKRRENVEEEWQRLDGRTVRKKVEEYGRTRWQAGMPSKSTLRWYREKERPEALHWHVGDWGSKLLVKARTGTLEVKARSRDEQDQDCSFCRGERETVEHFIVECRRYEQQRATLLEAVVGIIGESEWEVRREEGDRGILTVLGLYGSKGERERIIKEMKKFLMQAWEIRQRG